MTLGDLQSRSVMLGTDTRQPGARSRLCRGVFIAISVFWLGGCGNGADEGKPSAPETSNTAKADTVNPVDANGENGATEVVDIFSILPPTDGIRTPDETPLDQDLIAAFDLLQSGQMQFARMRLSQFINRIPEDGRAHFLMGLTYHQEYRYGQARPHFEAAAKRSPKYHPIWHFYGWCLYYLGEPELARRAIETHLEFIPTEGDSHFVLGLLDLDANDLNAAEARFREAIRHQAGVPGREGPLANAHTRLGEVHYRRGDLNAARQELETAIRIYPDQHQAMFQLYRVFSRLGEDEKAEAMLELHERTKARVNPRQSYEE